MDSATRIIPVGKDKFAIVDSTDYEFLSSFGWTAVRNSKNTTTYASTTNGQRMHRMIMGAPAGMEVDHLNMNGLDNRRANLRICTKSQNNANRRVQSNNKTGFKGVSLNRRRGYVRFEAMIYQGGKKTHLGTHKDPISAARAYDAEARVLFGEFARTNF